MSIRSLIFPTVLCCAWSPYASADLVKLQVPIDLKNLMDELSGIAVTCVVTSDDPQNILGNGGIATAVSATKFQEVLEVPVPSAPGKNYSVATQYRCNLLVSRSIFSIDQPLGEPPQGDGDDWRRFDPQAPFVIETSGSLSPTPGGLQAPGGN